MNNVNVKSALIIITTLIIGIAIGFELSEISIKKKLEKMDQFRGPLGFVQVFEDIINPDSSQKDKVGTILLRYHDKIDKVTKSGMIEVSAKLDSMAVELKQVLNSEQIARLNDEMQRMKRMPMPPKINGRPPMDGERMPPPRQGDEGRRPMPPPNEMRLN